MGPPIGPPRLLPPVLAPAPRMPVATFVPGWMSPLMTSVKLPSLSPVRMVTCFSLPGATSTYTRAGGRNPWPPWDPFQLPPP